MLAKGDVDVERNQGTTSFAPKAPRARLPGRSSRRVPRRLLKNPLSPRLLKKVQMQGGAPCTHPPGWVQVRGVLSSYVAAPRERGGTHPKDGSPQMGLFQQPASHDGSSSGKCQGATRPDPNLLNRHGHPAHPKGTRLGTRNAKSTRAYPPAGHLQLQWRSCVSWRSESRWPRRSVGGHSGGDVGAEYNLTRRPASPVVPTFSATSA